jgi:hypothetical protein
MRIRVAGQKEDERTIDLAFEVRGDEVIVIDKVGGWDLVAFRVDDNDQMVLARPSNIEDGDINTDEEGRIVEVEE